MPNFAVIVQRQRRAGGARSNSGGGERRLHAPGLFGQQLRSELDGCGEWRYLLRIVLPLSVPILAVVGLYFAVGYWNSYFDAMSIAVRSRPIMPLASSAQTMSAPTYAPKHAGR